MTEHAHKNKLMSEQLYTQRHNVDCKVIRWHICKNFEVSVPETLWEHEPKVITENMEGPPAQVRTNDPIECEHQKQSVATRYHTWEQKKEKMAFLIEMLIAVILD